MQFKVGFGTDIGLKRSQNQDSGIAVPELGLFVVADGMGGHLGGEIASSMATEVISSVIQEAQKTPTWDPKNSIIEAIQKANQAIFDRALKESSLHGMGTTTTGLLFKDNLLTIGHVGDSRCYYLNPGEMWQVTRDHSLVQEKLRAGIITREQLKTDQMKNVLTRSVGFDSNVEVEVYSFEVHPNGCFLICSDGLSGLVEDKSLLEITQKEFFEGGNIQNAVNGMISAAKTNGGDDNITCILVQVS
jgi:PPM family protein phosphatase